MRVPLVWLLAAGCACLAFFACVDAVHDSEVQSLGPESAGVPPGPLHRPGQPCLWCHGGSGPASLRLGTGGTIYAVKGQTQPASAAVVQIQDVDGRTWQTTSNAAGNFYIAADSFGPTYPTQMNVASSDGTTTQQMLTHSSRAGSCADCHVNPESSTSPGPVYLSTGSADAGGGGTD